jgi:hypothetical protein
VKVVRLNQVQPFIQLAIQAISEPPHLLCVGIHVVTAILAQSIELLCVVVHSVTSLLEG